MTLQKKRLDPWQRECGICHEIIKDGSPFAWEGKNVFYHLGCYHFYIYEEIIKKSDKIRSNIIKLALRVGKSQ